MPRNPVSRTNVLSSELILGVRVYCGELLPYGVMSEDG